MNEITNKQLFVTMIIIAVITIGVILSQGRTASYAYPTNYSSTLGASVYDAYNIDYSGSPTRLVRRRYIPVIHTTYPITTSQYYQYSTVPSSYQQTYTYTTYETDGGYVMEGCENGNNYSIVTGELCR